ncbi:Mob1/phocein [Dactylonectria macrodidyma]|uniref:Mob1/phocein n=1 Tax=Dactylonectria macrodidyma TaxID=307937 RepID=A0A9P9FEC4_9HYPO|nr:Mob1/phocein [Dactylonectria macrodidyma]
MSLAPSSPRLPSPPPAAEIQIAPNSPSGGPAATPQTSHSEQTLLDASSRRRIHPGTKAIDMAAGPPLIPLHEVQTNLYQLDSAFQLQEHLAALHCYHTASNTQPLTRATALQLAQPPNGIDRTIWLYELCRFLISQCNSLIVGFLFDMPPCSASTCPEMRASEWQFLCAVHEQPKSCCAIDYCCHTLDWAANVVTDQKIFPSRFVVLSDNHSKNVGVKNLVNVFRRLHRIFAHAWFQHRGVFWSVEGQTGLYVFFKTVCDLYDLLPAENYKLPPEAEGLEAPSAEQDMEKPTPTILKHQAQQRGPGGEDDSLHPARTNTRRHIRSSPSTGSAVTTVLEAEEEEASGVSRRLKDMHISAPSTVEEEPEVADVPVIVEQSVIAQSSAENQDPLTPDSEEDETEEDSDADQTVIDADPEEEAEPADDKDGVADEPAPPKEADVFDDAEKGDKPSDGPATKENPEDSSAAPAPEELEEPAEADPQQPTTEVGKKPDEDTTAAPSRAERVEDEK